MAELDEAGSAQPVRKRLTIIERSSNTTGGEVGPIAVLGLDVIPALRDDRHAMSYLLEQPAEPTPAATTMVSASIRSPFCKRHDAIDPSTDSDCTCA